MLLREQVRAKTLFAKLQQEYREAESAYIRFPSQSLNNTAEISLAKKKLDDAKRNLEYQDDKWESLNTKGIALRDHDQPHELDARELEWNEHIGMEVKRIESYKLPSCMHNLSESCNTVFLILAENQMPFEEGVPGAHTRA